MDAGNNQTITSLQDLDNYLNSEYASVGEQSGLFAGDGGYDIFTGNNTWLNGTVIASTADAASNIFSTGSFDSTQKLGEQYTASALPALVNMSGSASGTTRSAVADGTITVRNTQNQTQDVAGLTANRITNAVVPYLRAVGTEK